jgi:hypothetical protein
VRDAIVYKATTDDELRRRITELAEEYDVPVGADAVAIRRENQQVMVDGSYERRIEVLPRVRVPWRFSWSIDVLLPTTTLPGAPPR